MEKAQQRQQCWCDVDEMCGLLSNLMLDGWTGRQEDAVGMVDAGQRIILGIFFEVRAAVVPGPSIS